MVKPNSKYFGKNVLVIAQTSELLSNKNQIRFILVDRNNRFRQICLTSASTNSPNPGFKNVSARNLSRSTHTTLYSQKSKYDLQQLSF